jgi:hypothetical protein
MTQSQPPCRFDALPAKFKQSIISFNIGESTSEIKLRKNSSYPELDVIVDQEA